MLYLWKKKLKKLSKRSWKVRDHCHYARKYRGETFHNGSNYDFQFIIKELANAFEEQFQCLGENTEKYKPFVIPVKTEVTKIDKDGNKSVVTISYKIKFIDRETSLSNLFDNLTEGIRKTKWKDCDYFLEYESVEDNLIKYKCLSCNKDYSEKIDEEFKNRFKNTFKSSNNDINKFLVSLRKSVYP